jgi:hypothetical protein
MAITYKLLAPLLATVGPVFAGSPKIAWDLEKVDRGATVDVIVQFNGVPTETKHEVVWGNAALAGERIVIAIKGEN